MCIEKRNFNLSNKFEYGLDKQGGIKARETPVNDKVIDVCYHQSAQGREKREEFKEKINR